MERNRAMLRLWFSRGQSRKILTEKVKEENKQTNKTKQNKTKQNKTKQNKTKQNKTKQNKTKQNNNNKKKPWQREPNLRLPQIRHNKLELVGPPPPLSDHSSSLVVSLFLFPFFPFFLFFFLFGLVLPSFPNQPQKKKKERKDFFPFIHKPFQFYHPPKQREFVHQNKPIRPPKKSFFLGDSSKKQSTCCRLETFSFSIPSSPNKQAIMLGWRGVSLSYRALHTTTRLSPSPLLRPTSLTSPLSSSLSSPLLSTSPLHSLPPPSPLSKRFFLTSFPPQNQEENGEGGEKKSEKERYREHMKNQDSFHIEQEKDRISRYFNFLFCDLLKEKNPSLLSSLFSFSHLSHLLLPKNFDEKGGPRFFWTHSGGTEACETIFESVFEKGVSFLPQLIIGFDHSFTRSHLILFSLLSPFLSLLSFQPTFNPSFFSSLLLFICCPGSS